MRNKHGDDTPRSLLDLCLIECYVVKPVLQQPDAVSSGTSMGAVPDALDSLKDSSLRG